MYYKVEKNGYIIAAGTGTHEKQISKFEYDGIKRVVENKPTAPEGYDYKLRTDLTWELYELPPAPPEPEQEAASEDYEEALDRLGVSE